MRFLLVLTVKRGGVLPLNYQYPISSWIYKCIHRADSEFARFLHERGYGKKPFKFFTFSRLDVPKREIYEDRLIIQSREVYLTLSFLIEQAAEKFVTGVFLHQHAGIGDARSQVDFTVTRVEARPAPVKEEILVKTLSPMVVSAPEEVKGRLRARYLSPQEEGYGDYLLQNLIRKYESYARYTGNSIPADFDSQMTWQLEKGPVHSRLVTVKAGTAQETKVRGYDCRFRLVAPAPLVRIGLLAGFGEKNSLGFGCGEVVG